MFNVVLIHGWGFDESIWQPLAESIREHEQTKEVFAVKILDWQLTTDYLSKKINEDTFIIAWSLGGNLAVDIAFKNQHVNAVMLINYNPCFCKRPDWQQAMETQKLEQMKQNIIEDRAATLKPFYHWCCLGNQQSMKWYKNERLSFNIQQNTHDLLGGIQRLIDDDQRTSLSELTCPIEMFFSNKDILIPEQVSKHCLVLSKLIQCNMLIGASHLSPLLEVTQIQTAYENMLRKFA